MRPFAHQWLFPADSWAWRLSLFGVFAALRFYLVTWLGERVVGGHPHGRLCPQCRADGHDLLRGDANRRGAVAADDRHHAGAVDFRSGHLHCAAIVTEPGRRAGVDGGYTNWRADVRHAGADSGDACCRCLRWESARCASLSRAMRRTASPIPAALQGRRSMPCRPCRPSRWKTLQSRRFGDGRRSRASRTAIRRNQACGRC